MTPPLMYAETSLGLVRIPEEDAAVLDRYRDPGTVVQPQDAPVFERYPVMPLVYEPQYTGDPFPLYPLVDEEPEDGRYTCHPLPGTVVDGGFGRTIVVHRMPPREPELVYAVADTSAPRVEVGPCLDAAFGR